MKMNSEVLPAELLQAERLLAVINLDAIASNWSYLNQTSGKATAGAVVKADAYGHGMAAVAKRLEQAGCRLFFTASIQEAMTLRATLPDAEIAYFDGLQPHDMEQVLTHRIIPSVGDAQQLSLLRAMAKTTGAPIPAMMNIDTGMNRLGFQPHEIADMGENDWGDVVAWRMVYSHLACADEADHPMNAQQLKDFTAAITSSIWRDVPKSMAATGGIFLGQDYHFDITRPGIGLYGLMPNGDTVEGLTPALSLRAKTLQINTVQQGQTVGYGGSFTTTRPSRLATIAGGYADGINRKLSSKGQVMFKGLNAPMVGRVSMDVHVVDITDWPEDALKVGDWVVLLGDDGSSPSHPEQAITAHDWAKDCETIPYEMLTTLGLRAKRHYAGASVS